MNFYHQAILFSKLTFSTNLSGIPSKRQTVWIQMRSDILSGLIWLQTVCDGYTITTLVNVYVDLVVFTRIAGTIKTGSGRYWR